MINETNVEAHYANNRLLSVIKSGLENAGLDQENLTAMDLSPVDEFHIGGTQAKELCGPVLICFVQCHDYQIVCTDCAQGIDLLVCV